MLIILTSTQVCIYQKIQNKIQKLWFLIICTQTAT